MRLRPALMTCVIAALVMVAVRLSGIVFERQSTAQNESQGDTAAVIARDAAGLLALTQEYGLYRSERAAQQWALVHERLTQSLADYAAVDATIDETTGTASERLLAKLQDTARTLPQVFKALQASALQGDAEAERRETLTDQLVNETRRVSDGAFDLAAELAILRRESAERQRWLAVGTHVMLLMLTLILAGLLLRRVLSPIDKLRQVAGAVEAGDLSARSRLPGQDELGQLSLAFDTMTAALEQRDAELHRAKRAADAASATKSQFLANMSHEIRTPMNAVLGLNFLLERSELDPAQRDLVAKIGSASRSLLDVINAVLDLSKIEAGEMMLETAPFDPQSLLRDVAELFRAQAEAKGIALRLDIGPGLPTLLLGDGARLRQIVSNLVSNAIKFTAEGQVRIIARCSDADASPVPLEIAVEDSGIGIPAEALSRIFTPFTQADSSTSRRYGGTGLGLSIVKQLSELMGGEVHVSSSPGAGTRFVTRLAFEPARGLALPTRPLALLLASDDAVQREALQRLCADLGWATESVTNASALMARLHVAPPDLLLLDHRLLQPMDSPARHALQAGLATLPCVLMSRASAAVSPAGLRLPADVSSLFDAVHAALAERGAAGTLLASTRAASAVRLLPGVRVLVADDSTINLEVARRILEEEGAVVTLAQDGAAALVRLRSEPAGFDVVLMDVQMPVLDGLAAARSIRTDLGLHQLPILALTAGALLSERQRALDAGMNDFISKPFDPASLVLLVRQHVERVRGERLPVTTRDAEVPADAPDDTGGWPQLNGIVRDEARQRLLGDVNFFARLLERFIDEFTDLATDASAAMDAPAAASRLHKLGGSAGLLGAQALRDTARRGENLARAGDDFSAELAEVRSLMQALTAEARPWLQQRNEAPADAPAEPLDDTALAEFRQALQTQDLAALNLFEQLAPALRGTLDEAAFTRLRDAVGRLDFAAALDAVNTKPD